MSFALKVGSRLQTIDCVNYTTIYFTCVMLIFQLVITFATYFIYMENTPIPEPEIKRPDEQITLEKTIKMLQERIKLLNEVLAQESYK